MVNRSTFIAPDYTIDTFIEHLDISASDLTNVNRYKTLKLKFPRTPEEDIELNNLITLLRDKIFSPEDFNKLQDCIVNMENFMKNEVEDYVLTKQSEFQAEIDKFNNKGYYIPGTQYYKNNFVTFNDGTGIKTYLCLQTCINIDPTNLTYWRVLTITGEKGEDGIGIGLTFKGAYSTGTIYAKDEAVQYGGLLFASLIDNNVGNTPDLTQDTAAWAKALDITTTPSELKGIRTIATVTSNVNFMTGEIVAFNPSTDTLEVRKNTTVLAEGMHYSINANNQSIDNLQGTWDGTIESIVFEFVVKRNQINNLVFSDGQSIELGSIDKTRLTTDVQDTLDEVVENTNKIGILSGEGGLVEKANKSELDNTNNTVMSHLNDTTSYSTYKLNLDSEGIFTEIQYKRPNGTLILKSVLSGGTSPQYTTRTETEYEQDGTTVKATRIYTISYDEDGNVVSEVLQ